MRWDAPRQVRMPAMTTSMNVESRKNLVSSHPMLFLFALMLLETVKIATAQRAIVMKPVARTVHPKPMRGMSRW